MISQISNDNNNNSQISRLGENVFITKLPNLQKISLRHCGIKVSISSSSSDLHLIIIDHDDHDVHDRDDHDHDDHDEPDHDALVHDELDALDRDDYNHDEHDESQMTISQISNDNDHISELK